MESRRLFMVEVWWSEMSWKDGGLQELMDGNSGTWLDYVLAEELQGGHGRKGHL